MKAFFRHMFICIVLFRLGYFFTKNTHNHETWGFYRLNFMQPDGEVDYSIFDIDFGREKGQHHFVHMHGNAEIHRYDVA